MEQTLSPSHQTPQPSPASAQVRAACITPQAAAADEDPESPGRSPRQLPSPAASPDPLAEGMALIAGIVLALMAVLVPIAAVVSDSRLPESSDSIRAGW